MIPSSLVVSSGKFRRRFSTISFLTNCVLMTILNSSGTVTVTETGTGTATLSQVQDGVIATQKKLFNPFLSLLRQDDVDIAERRDRNVSAKRQSFRAGGNIEKSTPFTIALGQAYNTKEYSKHFLTEKDATRLNTPQLIEAVGYKVEAHKVTTADGYILTLFRIRSPKRKCLDSKKRPIFFQHGVVDSSRAWLILDGDTGPAYTATKYGYDVWLGNSRGTSYSLGHTRYSNKDPRYWKFSWHEMGQYDLPAVFDYILKVTKLENTNERQQINYVGHSMGTTMFYVCLSLRPEYNKIIANMVALPPSSYLSSITSPLQLLKPYTKLYNDILIDGPFLWSEVNHLIHKIGPPLCNIQVPIFSRDEVCLALVALLEGASYLEKNNTILHRVLGGFPDTTSKKTIAHFLQLVNSEYFTQFDYGLLGNYRRYGKSVPPKYNLFSVGVRTLNLYGQQDILIDYKDSETSNADLGTGYEKYNTLIFDYSHVDFIWGKTAGPIIASRIFKFFRDDDRKPKPMTSKNQRKNSQTHCQCKNQTCHKTKHRVDVGSIDYYL